MGQPDGAPVSLYPRYERAADIDRLLHLHTTSRPGDVERYNHDPQAWLQRNVLRDALLRMDRAMDVEGVDGATRDRVLHRVVFCEAPEDTADRLDRNGEENARVSLGRWEDLPADTKSLLLNLRKRPDAP